MDFVSFFTGSAAGAVALYLIQSLFQHRLAKDLSASDRRADAARDFRAKVNEALTLFQKPDENWGGNNRTSYAMRNFVSAIDLAVKDYASLCSGSQKTKFQDKWQQTKEYCSTTLPRAVTSDDAGRSHVAKTTFLKHVEELLSLAKT